MLGIHPEEVFIKKKMNGYVFSAIWFGGLAERDKHKRWKSLDYNLALVPGSVH